MAQGFDWNDDLRITARKVAADEPKLYRANTNPSPQEIAAQGYQTIASVPADMRGPHRNVTYNDCDEDDGLSIICIR